jgi:predicted ATPase
MVDRISEIRIEGLRTIESLTLKLDGLTVLIGENGTGKSTILEACELLRRAAQADFMADFHAIHGGMFSLLRDGASRLTLGVRVDGSDDRIDYEFTLVPQGVGAVIASEHLGVRHHADGSEPLPVIHRNPTSASVYSPLSPGRIVAIQPERTRLILGSSGLFSPHPAMDRLRAALAGIEVHLGFEVLPLWVARAFKRRSDARGSILLEPTTQLSPLASNLANVYHALRNEFGEDHWRDTMEYVRMGLGPEVVSVNTRADAGGGAIALTLSLKARAEPMPAAVLSDGQLAYLAFVGLYRLKSQCTILAMDEPELHLHPGLLTRVVQFLAASAESHPVLLATHSDHLLDVLTEPARAVRVCERVNGQTNLRSLDSEALAAWLVDYRGLGALRGDGFMPSVLKEDP